MILSPLNTILFFACVFIAFSVIVAVSDLFEARARRRHAARRRRIARLDAYTVRDGREPFNPDALAHDNVVDLHQHSVKVGDAA